MLDYFKVYSWNLALSMALDAGANMDEVDRACRALRDVEDDSGHANDYFEAWVQGGARLARSAAEDEAAGHLLSAGEKYRRACLMYLTGERIPAHDHPPRRAAYDELLRTFGKFIECAGANCERVKVPFGDSFLPALMVSVGSADQPAPCIVHFNGLDGIKEYLYLCGLPAQLSQRGVSVLLVDNPGVGEALRKNGLHNAPEAEIPAGACVDFLEGRADVDRTRIGMMALSLGGYHAPRAAAFEPRFACCVAWGANHDWPTRFRKRMAGTLQAQNSVPHYMAHNMWVLGKDSIEACAEVIDRFSLDGVVERIRVPIYITHGEDDRQIPVSEAYKTYEGCVNSPRRELRIFTAQEGGEQHCSIGCMTLATNAMADWIADVLRKV